MTVQTLKSSTSFQCLHFSNYFVRFERSHYFIRFFHLFRRKHNEYSLINLCSVHVHSIVALHIDGFNICKNHQLYC